MARFYEMPAVSPTMELGTLVAWRVQEGQAFKPQTVMAEVGTDKANMEAEIFDSGVLIKHLVAEGAEVPAGYPIAIVGERVDEDISALLAEFAARAGAGGGGAAMAPAAPLAPVAAPPAPVAAPAPVVAPAAAAPAAPPRPAPAPNATTPGAKVREWNGKALRPVFMDPPGDIGAANVEGRLVASPLARKVAAERGVDLRNLTGSGPNGRIVKDDVLAAASAPVAAPAGPAARPDEVVRNSPMRKTIAKRLLESHQGIPTFYLTVELDMQGFVDLREQLKARAPDVKASYNDMLVMAVARALREYPKVNASWSDGAITRHGAVDIGIAVALPDGLITPVVRHADTKRLAAIAKEIRDLAGLAREQKLQPDQYQGNTFTISNLGMFGIHEFTAIINPPASAILAVGALERVPVIGADGEVRAAWRMKVTMTCDHRVIDGATGAEFLQVLRRYVEAPALLLV